jgi:hypothetical protein
LLFSIPTDDEEEEHPEVVQHRLEKAKHRYETGGLTEFPHELTGDGEA